MRTATPGLLESEGKVTRPVMAADDEHQFALLSGHVEPACDKRSRESIEHHRGEDHDEDDRQHEVGARNSLVLELEAEGRRRRPATIPRGAIQARNPRSGQVSEEREAARRTTSGRRTSAMHQHEHDRLGQHASNIARGDRCGDEHEQDADQELHERLLELAGERDVETTRRVDPELVAEGDAHHRRSDEARVLAQKIRGDNCRDHDHQRGEDRHPRLVELNLAEENPEDRRTGGADQRPHGEAQQELTWLPARANEVKDDNAKQCADRVDEHALPLQHGPDRRGRTNERKERKHDGRTGDDEDRADLDSHAVAHAVEEQRDGDRDAGARDDDADGDETRDDLARSKRDLAEREPEPGLEQDDADGE